MVVCCGEALIDMLPREATGGEAAFAPFAGGAVFNTAIALARLEQDTAFVTGLSTDLFGAQLEAVLTASGVDHSGCVRSPRPTTLAFVTLTDGQARYAFYDENTAGRMFAVEEMPKAPEADRAHFFGGISLVSEPGGSAYETLMAQVAPTALTMIDPNIRPGFITDEAAYRARINRMIAIADIVKLSDEDLHWLEGDGEIAPLAQGLLDKGAQLVCITEGAKGARAFWGNEEAFVAATPVEVVDTVGAGDTFNAGVLAGLAQRGTLDKGALAGLTAEDVAHALRLGVKAAAVTVSRAGANPPRLSELS
ncbi:carbohydrate kinase family protein [Pseudoruegeria sp. SHC-113]|uniref:carbohydrate kinase family protein n=1 Tax=Pseudoruegeria sp. SHC-113 TaxID=2855439 RepID=UPI0021BA8ECF|nr:carbohydrate kinase [Pseudoruegeria sp. SHC-113]MCT8159595.1 carbohydrate kinase [Pseudoruegeria sp. SHC-113]